MRNLALFGVVAIALMGCKDRNSGDDSGLPDIDGDGYDVTQDCDDENAAINPGADEICDGIDNNCDEEIDNEPVDGVNYYRDGDGDGYGDDDRVTLSCEALTDYVLEGGDCNDGRNDIFPGAPEEDCADPTDYNCDGSTGYADGDGDGYPACEDCDDGDEFVNPDGVEICDDVDNDCDGLVDDEDPELTGAPTWYQDRDEDNYGTAAFTTAACERPEGFADNADDCNDNDGGINPETSWYADSDGDSYGDPDSSQQSCTQPANHVLNDEDCDDGDASVNPQSSWFLDGDGDGYGDEDSLTQSCEAPSGYAATGGDCDDSDSGVNPAADELCSPSGSDEDCDGQVDESGAIDAADWFQDSDGDGFGDTSTSTPACLEPNGFVSDDSDCDDADSAVNPDAEEICNDGVDNNCSGGFDSCALELEDADLIFEGPTTNAAAGGQISAAGDIDGDGNDDLWISAYLEAANGSESGATYLFHGPFSSGTISMSSYDARLYGEADDRSGQSTSGGYDLNNDGINDVLISAHRNDGDQANRAGMTYLLFGGSSVTGDIDLTSDADVYFIGESSWDRLGLASLMVGDIVGNARDDVAIGAPFRNDNSRSDNGAVYVAAGPFSSGIYDIEDSELILEGEASNDQVGTKLAAGDLDGDGVNELIIGAQLQDSAGASAGAVYLIEGDTTGRLDLADHASLSSVYKIEGETGSDSAGVAVATGDLNNDGTVDLIVSATGDDDGGVNAGAIYVLTGTTAMSAASFATNDVKLRGAAGETIGDSVSGAGDVDGDGAADLLIGASSAGTSGEGGAFLVFGPLTSATYALATDADATFFGETVNDAAGSEVQLILDIGGTGDGLYDVFVGSANADRNGTDSGAVYGIFDVGL